MPLNYPNSIVIVHSNVSKTPTANELSYSYDANSTVNAVFSYFYNSTGSFNLSLIANIKNVTSKIVYFRSYEIKDGIKHLFLLCIDKIKLNWFYQSQL